MRRSTRAVSNWEKVEVKDPEKPYIYIPHYDDLSFEALASKNIYREFKSVSPYEKGDIVFVEVSKGVAKRALIYQTHVEISEFSKEPMIYYRAQMETKAGVFSKLWVKVYSGYIQRGYEAAEKKVKK